MAAGCKVLGNPLEVGKWIQFVTSKKEVSEHQKGIYQNDKYFFVISKEPNVFLGNKYTLIDIVSQKICMYLPAKNSMDSIFLVFNSKVNVVSQEDLEAKYDAGKVKAAYKTAEKYIKNHKVDLEKNRAQIFKI